MDRFRAVSVCAAALTAGTAVGQAQYRELDLGRLPASSAAAATAGLAALDVDRDGFTDLFAARRGPSSAVNEQNALLRNDRRGGFVDVSAGRIVPLADDSRDAAAGDVNGDGFDDVVVANAGPNRLLVNDGAGRLLDVLGPTWPAGGAVTTLCVVLVDVDADGDLDLFEGNAGQDRLLLNDSFGGFVDVTPTRVPTDTGHTAAVVSVDVDRDGDLDLVLGRIGVASGGGAANVLLRNDGRGRFFDTSASLPRTVEATRSLAIGDFNRDGAPDLVTGNDGRNRLFVNTGRGDFQDVTRGNLQALRGDTRAVFAHDVDGDGDADLVYGENARGPVVLLNNGRSQFAWASTRTQGLPVGAVGLRSLALVDVDADQDRDLLVGGAARDALVLDLARQLDAPTEPVVGQPFALDVWARPGFPNGPQTVLPLASVALARVPFVASPFGVFWLDPVAFVVGDELFVSPATGKATAFYTVPAGMRGITVHFQASVMHGSNVLDWRLSNLLSVTVR